MKSVTIAKTIGVAAAMGAFHMIADLPRTGSHMAEYYQGQIGDDDQDLYVPPFDPREMVGSVAHHELALASPLLYGLSEMPRHASMQEQCSRSGATYWAQDAPRLPERVRSHPFPSPVDGINPLPYNLVIPRDASPDGWWASDRPAIEPNPWAGESSQSALTSEGRPEYDPVSFRPHAPWEDWHRAACFDCLGGCSPNFPGYGNPKADGIALCDIESFPDPDAEQLREKSTPEMRIKPEPGVESVACTPSSRPPTGSSISVPDEDTADSSILDDDDDRIMGNDVRDEDVSDYTPTAPPKRSPRRGPAHAVTANPHQSKRPGRARNPTAFPSKPTAKITKRLSAPKTLAPTPSASRLTSSKRGSVTCPQCPQRAGIYPSESALHKHTLASHTRPFICTFRRYGCPSTFGSKNEWKRHVSSQHLRLGIYRCDMDKCVPQESKPSHRRKLSSASHADGRPAAGKSGSYNDFNRKDLFTQHVRRMHGSAISASGNGMDASEETLERIQKRCWKKLRETPPASICGICPHVKIVPPAAGDAGQDRGPPASWEGSNSWDVRMEHVGRHLEKGEGDGKEDEDEGLREWMVRERLLTPSRTGGWVVVGCGGRKRGKGAGTEVGGKFGMESAIGTRGDVRPAAGPENDGDLDADGDDMDYTASGE